MKGAQWQSTGKAAACSDLCSQGLGCSLSSRDADGLISCTLIGIPRSFMQGASAPFLLVDSWRVTSPWGKKAGFCAPCGSALALKIWAGYPFGPEFAPKESNSAPFSVSWGNREGSCVRLAPAPAFFCPARANSAASPHIWIQLPNKRLSVTHSSPPSLLCASRGLSCSQGE